MHGRLRHRHARTGSSLPSAAAYLFLINAFFIALATFLFVRLLGLPKHKDADPQRQRRAHLVIGMGVLALALPSAYLAYGLVQDQIFLASSRGVVAEVARQPGVILIAKEVSLPDRTLSMVLARRPARRGRRAALAGPTAGQGFRARAWCCASWASRRSISTPCVRSCAAKWPIPGSAPPRRPTPRSPRCASNWPPMSNSRPRWAIWRAN
ncbi:hypothetical protein LP420_38780 [Massilia sp. B-10]|nr:hypothetical protein LP420_38780 [Massilia sp. B-10]